MPGGNDGKQSQKGTTRRQNDTAKRTWPKRRGINITGQKSPDLSCTGQQPGKAQEEKTLKTEALKRQREKRGKEGGRLKPAHLWAAGTRGRSTRRGPILGEASKLKKRN